MRLQEVRLLPLHQKVGFESERGRITLNYAYLYRPQELEYLSSVLALIRRVFGVVGIAESGTST